MKYQVLFVGTLVFVLSLDLGLPAAATLTIDETREFQTIEGFGAFGAKRPPWTSSDPSAFYDDAFLNQVFNDLGLTVTRFEWYPPTDKNKQSTFDPWLRAYKKKAASEGIEWNVILTIWTPPIHMKTNNANTGYGTLKPEYRKEYGEYLVKALDHYKNNLGIDVLGISPQNEPNLQMWYNGCNYTPPQYAEMFKVVAPIIHAKYPKVKIFGPDAASGAAVQYLNYFLKRDPEPLKDLDVFGIHGYVGADTPDPNATSASVWQSMADRCERANADLWMTETSGQSNQWGSTDGGDAWDLGTGLFASLKYGNLSLWTFWGLSMHEDDPDHHALIVKGRMTKRAYASKQFYRYIRPGAVRIACSDDIDNVEGVAFRHKAKKTLAVVILNSSTSAQTVTLDGYDLPGRMERYVTDASKNCAKQSSVSVGGSVSLPAKSITTLYGTGYNPPQRTVTIDHPGARTIRGAARAKRGAIRSFGLDGSLRRASAGRRTGLQPTVVEILGRDGKPVARRMSIMPR